MGRKCLQRTGMYRQVLIYHLKDVDTGVNMKFQAFSGIIGPNR